MSRPIPRLAELLTELVGCGANDKAWALDDEQRELLVDLLSAEAKHAAEHAIYDPDLEARARWERRLSVATSLADVVTSRVLMFESEAPIDPPEATLLGELEAAHGVVFVRLGSDDVDRVVVRAQVEQLQAARTKGGA